MAYCFMTMQKVKSLGALGAKFNHNFRIADVKNAAPELSHLNDELIKLPEKNGKKMNYVDMFNERISTLPYYNNHSVRKNAVLAIEVVTTFSGNEDIDIERWKEKNVEWLKDTFNVAGDDRDNVISVVYHGDEAGNVHCHAMVIPIDEQGKLNGSRFMGDSKILTNLQTSYAKDMEEVGLKRGLKGSTAKHKDIRKFYAELNQAIRNIPEPVQNETARDYMERVKEEIGVANAAALRRLTVGKQEKIHEINEAFNEKRDELIRERNSYTQTKDKVIKDIENLQSQRDHLINEIENLSNMVQSMYPDEKERERYSRFKHFEDNYNKWAAEFPEEAMDFERYAESILAYKEEEMFRGD